MKRIPFDQYRMWMAVRETELERHTLNEYYLMAIRADIKALFSTQNVTIESMRLKFKGKNQFSQSFRQSKDYIEYSKAAWRALGSVSGPRPGAKQ